LKTVYLTKELSVKYLYEFIGTFFLVFTVGMTVSLGDNAAIVAPIAIASVLAVMIYAGGHLSGGHYNPAVSLAVFLRGKLSREDLVGYWLVQLLAGVVAAYITMYFIGTTEHSPSMDMMKIFPAEFLFTFALCFVALNVAFSKATKGNSYFGFAIGFTVLVGAYAVGDISGAALNPAVALGVTIMNMAEWTNLWAYFVATLLAGAFAAYITNNAEKA
jgi:aquaporin Z